MEDPHTISLQLDADSADRLRAWAEQSGARGGLDAAAARALREFLDGLPRQGAVPLGPDLTRTEREVMQRTARGEDLADIAEALGLKPNTVAQARYRALRKGAPDSERVTLGQMRERDFERAAARLLGPGADVQRALVFLRPPADLHDSSRPEGPDHVRLGLPPGRFVHAVPPAGFHPCGHHSPPPLSGFTNRIGPTLWASSQLVDLAMDEGPVSPERLLESIVPRAWRIGADLDTWEKDQRKRIQGRPGAKRRGVPFHFSARWPSATGPETREASSLVGFVNFSVGEWARPGRSPVGPLFALGLAEVVESRTDQPQRYLWPTTKACELAARLGDVGASCWYPYSDPAWHVIRECLRVTPNAELLRTTLALRAFSESGDTKEFQRRVVQELDEVDREAGHHLGTGSRSASASGGHLARLREFGLVTIPGAYDLDLYRPLVDPPQPGAPAFGPDAVTHRGWDLLDVERAQRPAAGLPRQ